VVTGDDIQEMIGIARRIHVATPIREYLVDAAEATRADPDILLGASPRATLFLQRAARTRAAVEGRNYVIPDDVKAVMGPVLNHRLILRPEAQMRGTQVSQVVDGIAASVEVPGSGARA
jgi:MoxR-like ATPase